jgi:hypothetical protein
MCAFIYGSLSMTSFQSGNPNGTVSVCCSQRPKRAAVVDVLGGEVAERSASVVIMLDPLAVA